MNKIKTFQDFGQLVAIYIYEEYDDLPNAKLTNENEEVINSIMSYQYDNNFNVADAAGNIMDYLKEVTKNG